MKLMEEVVELDQEIKMKQKWINFNDANVKEFNPRELVDFACRGRGGGAYSLIEPSRNIGS